MRVCVHIVVLGVLALGSMTACDEELVDGGVELTKGTVPIEAPPPSSRATHVFIPFTPHVPGEIGVSVDWDPRTSRVSFAVSEGECSSLPCPAELDRGPYTDGATNKPISGMNYLSARRYTLRIDNWGPGGVTASYVVRLIPGQ
jgi:hypothetical protein